MNRLAFFANDVETFRQAEAFAYPNETGAFFLLGEGKGKKGRRLVASRPYYPVDEEWDIMEPDRLRPSTQLISKMVSRAEREKSGLLFLHSHPSIMHPAGFSMTDFQALNSLASTIPSLLEGPFAAAVKSKSNWEGLVWDGSCYIPIERITSAGRCFSILNAGEISPNQFDSRQLLALGDINKLIRQLDIAIVGCGGLGSPLAETLVRMGIRSLTLIDHDKLDTPSNIRRVFGSKVGDLHRIPAPSKVSLVGGLCSSLGFETEIIEVVEDVRNERAFSYLLDTDIVFCGTDSHSSRAVLNAGAHAFFFPIIDCGVRVGVRHGRILSNLFSNIRIISPGLPCLWCRKVISSETIREENLPSSERAMLQREDYVAGVAGPEPSTVALTLLGSSMMACALLAMLSEDGKEVESGYFYDGFWGEVPIKTETPVIDPDCLCLKNHGRAEKALLCLKTG